MCIANISIKSESLLEQENNANLFSSSNRTCEMFMHHSFHQTLTKVLIREQVLPQLVSSCANHIKQRRFKETKKSNHKCINAQKASWLWSWKMCIFIWTHKKVWAFLQMNFSCSMRSWVHTQDLRPEQQNLFFFSRTFHE